MFTKLSTYFFAALILIIVKAPPNQRNVELTVFLDEDSLTIFVPGTQTILLDRIGFEYVVNDSPVTRFIDQYATFSPLRFQEIAAPICLRLQRYRSNIPLPLECQNIQTLIHHLSDVDIFWYDENSHQTRTMFLVQMSLPPTICGAGQLRCSFKYEVPEYAAPPTTRLDSLPPKIAYYSDLDGDAEIYVVDVDGSNLFQLTNNKVGDYAPDWSPDGSQIAFYSDRDGNNEIYVMDADGSNIIRLTDREESDSWPTWSPDGSRIAFVSGENDDAEIYVIEINTNKLTRLTTNNVGDYAPDWSSNDMITFHSMDEDFVEIFVMNSDGAGRRVVTSNRAGNRYPTWSPDGSRIAFHSLENGEIFIIDADGSNLVQLTHNSSDDYGPDWSPDGTQIVFHSLRDGNREIYEMNTDGSNQTRITHTESYERFPTWQP